MAQQKTWTVIGIIGVVVVILGTIIYFPIKNGIVNRYKNEITEEEMRRAFQENILTYAEKLRAFPDEKTANQEIRANKLGFDAWGKPIKYIDNKREGYVELRSSGVDGELDTADDIVVTSKEMPASFGSRQGGNASKGEKGKRGNKK